jgi:hypothetical protein
MMENPDIPSGMSGSVEPGTDPHPTGGMDDNQLLAQIYDARYVEKLNEVFDDGGDYISLQPHSVFPPVSRRLTFRSLPLVRRFF